MKTRAVGTEVKVQLLSAAKRLVGRIRRRVSTAARQDLCVLRVSLCGVLFPWMVGLGDCCGRTGRKDRWRWTSGS
jgi:hypothetical protein